LKADGADTVFSEEVASVIFSGENALDVLAKAWTIFASTLGTLGIIFTIFDVYQTRSILIEWLKKRKELSASTKALRQTDRFIVHVVHVGGAFSMIYSLLLRVDDRGGWYLNPPNRFLNVAWNRGGDLMILSPTEFAQKNGKFVADQYKNAEGKFVSLPREECCHLPITDMRNEFEIRFVRLNG
jgi:hypothetical protein